jgi:hypothetical protein
MLDQLGRSVGRLRFKDVSRQKACALAPLRVPNRYSAAVDGTTAECRFTRDKAATAVTPDRTEAISIPVTVH